MTPKIHVASHFNDYFINVGPNLANKITHNDNNNFDKYLKGSCISSFLLIISHTVKYTYIICTIIHETKCP